MTEHIVHNCFDILRGGVRTAVDERIRTGRLVERKRRTRRRTYLNLFLEGFKPLHILRFTRGEHDIEDVISDLLVAIYLLERVTQ